MTYGDSPHGNPKKVPHSVLSVVEVQFLATLSLPQKILAEIILLYITSCYLFIWGPKKSFNSKESSEAFPRIF